MADLVVLIVRYLHILSAILWIGALGFSVMVLRSAMARVPVPARKETMRQLVPIVIRFIPASAILTILFGALLYLVLGDFNPTILWGTNWGLVLLTSLLLTVILFAFGLTMVARTSQRILGHLNEEACTHGEEVGRLQKMFNRGQIAAFAWGVLILALMVLATEGL
jgi:uncharacterized membrane protein